MNCLMLHLDMDSYLIIEMKNFSAVEQSDKIF